MWPVVLAAPRSVGLICRDDSDEWRMEPGELASKSYNALKLKRLSFFLDVGLPHGNPMGFAFDGSLLIARNPHIRSSDDAADEFNAVLAALHLGGLPQEQVSSKDLSFGELQPTGYFRYRDAHDLAGRVQIALGEGEIGSYLGIDLRDPPKTLRADIEAAYASGKPVLTAIAPVSAAALLSAFSHYRRGELRNSMIYGWLVVEQIISLLWDQDFLGNPDVIGYEERRGGLNSVARQVAGKIELLAQAGLLGKTLYLDLSSARKARNQLIHRGTKPTHVDCRACLSAIADLIALKCSRLSVPFDPDPLKIDDRASSEGRPAGVVRSEDVDWTKVGMFRIMAPIPGEAAWRGDYESFSDITLRDASAEVREKGKS